MKFLVHTPYRCGSTFIAHLIKKNTRYNICWHPDSIPLEQDNIIFKCHYCKNIDSLKNRSINYIFTSIRQPTEIFISAYIKDFKKHNNQFPYYYRKEPLIINVEDMVEHFLSFDWLQFKYLSYEAVFNQIKTISGIDIWDLDFDKSYGCQLYSNNITKLIIVTHKTLFRPKPYKNFCSVVQKELRFHRMYMGNFSFSNYDEYGELYKKFQEKIPKTFFEQYKNTDDKIISKFLIEH